MSVCTLPEITTPRVSVRRGIRTRFFGPDDSGRGARIQASIPKAFGVPMVRITKPWDYAVTVEVNHYQAAQLLVDKRINARWPDDEPYVVDPNGLCDEGLYLWGWAPR
tara:strand:+ start:1033 stop:1356 length:324 start_codon:yes stop_codon:yes gene_type:complete